MVLANIILSFEPEMKAMTMYYRAARARGLARARDRLPRQLDRKLHLCYCALR